MPDDTDTFVSVSMYVGEPQIKNIIKGDSGRKQLCMGSMRSNGSVMEALRQTNQHGITDRTVQTLVVPIQQENIESAQEGKTGIKSAQSYGSIAQLDLVSKVHKAMWSRAQLDLVSKVHKAMDQERN
uniref:Uncharacterized protein n=1 Tax=Timema tahoe TaxID=61484 RepID=A0A7R9ING7_9NEOP|nr:unnamed protein product [Timema tahoe]